MAEYVAVDLFSGTGSSTEAFRESDKWKVIEVEFEEKFNPDICKDIMNLDRDELPEQVDFVWASPPCTKFSVASIGHSWIKFRGNYYPKSEEVIDAVRLVKKTVELIEEINPEHWFLENPRGMMRNILGDPEGTVTYCQYGFDRMKPTDLWGEIPEGFEFKSCSNGADCHDSAPRGSNHSGLQGVENKEDRARVPYELSKSVFESVQGELSE